MAQAVSAAAVGTKVVARFDAPNKTNVFGNPNLLVKILSYVNKGTLPAAGRSLVPVVTTPSPVHTYRALGISLVKEKLQGMKSSRVDDLFAIHQKHFPELSKKAFLKFCSRLEMLCVVDEFGTIAYSDQLEEIPDSIFEDCPTFKGIDLLPDYKYVQKVETADFLKFSRRVPIEHLTLWCNFGPVLVEPEVFSSLTHLQVLHIQSPEPQVSQTYLNEIRKLPALRELTLGGVEEEEEFSGFPSLEILILHNYTTNLFSERVIDNLSAMKNLREVTVDLIEQPDTNWMTLAKIPHLKKVYLNNSEIDRDNLLALIVECRSLKTLVFINYLSAQTLNILRSLQQEFPHIEFVHGWGEPLFPESGKKPQEEKE